MQPPPPRAPGLGALLLAFVAGGLGGAAAALLVSPRGPAHDSDDAGLRPSITALDESVKALSQRVADMGRQAPSVQPGRSPVESIAPETTSVSNDDLVSVALMLGKFEEDIAKLIEARAAAGQGFPGSGPLPLLDPTRAPADRSALIALANEENDASRPLWRRHAFWTCQQVIDAYGLPDQIEYGDGSMGWYYDTGQRTIHFVFYEGMLINIWS
jgi:hypothetical protein